MKKVLFDTCILIRLMNEADPLHADVFACFKYCLENKMLVMTSTVCIAEYAVQAAAENIFPEIKVLPFSHEAAIIAGGLATPADPGDKRDCVKDDFKIIATAVADDIDFIVTKDKKTFAKYAARAKTARGAKFKVVLIDGSEPFSERIFNDGIGEDNPIFDWNNPAQ